MDPCIFVLKTTTASAVDGIRKDKLFEESVSLLPESARQIPPESFTPIRGFLVVLIDDILEAGDQDHRVLVSRLLSRFRTGRHTCLMDKGGGIYNGRRIEQFSNFSVQVHMCDYIDEKIQPLAIPRDRKKERETPL